MPFIATVALIATTDNANSHVEVTLCIIQGLQTLLFFVAVFMPHNSKRCKWHRRIASKLWFGIVFTLVLFSPLAILVFLLFSWEDVKDSSISNWCYICIGVSITVVIWIPLQFCRYWSVIKASPHHDQAFNEQNDTHNVSA